MVESLGKHGTTSESPDLSAIDPPALLLVGHGTRAEAGVEQFRQQVSLVGEAMAKAGRSEANVDFGFLEFSEPPIDQAVDALVATGASRVVAVPIVLLAAGHMKLDGPALLARAGQRHPEVAFSYARDLGVHPVPLEIATEMATALLAPTGPGTALTPRTQAGKAPAGIRFRVEADRSAVVLVGRGSTDPDANSDLYKIARLLSDSRGLPLVEPAFVSLAPPSVTDALDRLDRLGATRIAVVPYFLFAGILSDRIAEQAAGWATNHPGVEVLCTGAMGPDARLASLIVDRYVEAASGPVAVNCDCCIYRTALPGYEERHATAPAGHHSGHYH